MLRVSCNLSTMAYSYELAARVRNYLSEVPGILITEKKMFGGLGFMVNDKMCINIMGERLMCRFDPQLEEEIAGKTGYLPMNMKKKPMRGYCLVEEAGYFEESDLSFWIELCLAFNDRAKSSKKK